MKIYLAADTNDDFTVSAFGFKLEANTPIVTSKHVGWTVVEAYLNGLRSASDYIIKHQIEVRTKEFRVITPSAYIFRLINTDFINELKSSNWVDPITNCQVIHRPLLESIHMHIRYYHERKVKWFAESDVTQKDADRFMEVLNEAKSILI